MVSNAAALSSCLRVCAWVVAKQLTVYLLHQFEHEGGGGGFAAGAFASVPAAASAADCGGGGGPGGEAAAGAFQPTIWVLVAGS